MILTEEGAKTKWCPCARQSQSNDATYNRSSDSGVNCIASACMAWRWHTTFDVITGEPIQDGKGYCGLAGHP